MKKHIQSFATSCSSLETTLNFRIKVNPIFLKTCRMRIAQMPTIWAQVFTDIRCINDCMSEFRFTVKRRNLTAIGTVCLSVFGRRLPLEKIDWQNISMDLSKLYGLYCNQSFYISIRTLNYDDIKSERKREREKWNTGVIMFVVHSCYRRCGLNYEKLIHQVINIPFKFFTVIRLFLFLVHYLFLSGNI